MYIFSRRAGGFQPNLSKWIKYRKVNMGDRGGDSYAANSGHYFPLAMTKGSTRTSLRPIIFPCLKVEN